jgi:hypothetical protein
VRRWFALLLALALPAAAPGCSKGSRSADAPVASLGLSIAAEREFRPLLRRWMLATSDGRRALDAELGRLIARHPSDPLAALADVLRGWDALERGDEALALRLVKPALDGPPGTAHDLATLVLGSAARRSMRSGEALRLLTPLIHKLIDPFATVVLDEEVVVAATQAGRWSDALKWMDVWMLESAPGDRDGVVAKIATLLQRFPQHELLADARRRVRAKRHVAPEGRRLAEAIARHLARTAISDSDVPLARVLLADLGPLLGREGEDIARLAADVARGRVTAKTVGVLLALGSTALERRSADVVSGMAFGLRVGDASTRLVTRDDGGRPEAAAQALIDLAADGAAVIVAGIDPRHTRQAAQFASQQGLPLVLLAGNDDDAMRSTEVFLLGADPKSSVGALAASLRERGAKVVAGLGSPIAVDPDDSRLGLSLQTECAPTPASEALSSERVDAIVALDGAYCTTEVVELAGRLRAPMGVGLGAMVGVALPEGARVAAAGIFPLAPNAVQDEPRLQIWGDTGRPPPSWWMALGRDAAVLTATAVRDLADAATEMDVRVRRLQATAALAGAKQDLWTTEAKGFDAQRRMPRDVRFVESRRRRAP